LPQSYRQPLLLAQGLALLVEQALPNAQ